MTKLPLTTGTFHFVAIAGIGMSGVAEVLHNLGCRVQGSHEKDGPDLQRLAAQGIITFASHAAAHIAGADVLVVSTAVKDDNPEVVAARAQGLPVLHRADILAGLMRLKQSVGVAGTHGKTTTSSLIGHLFEVAGLDPTLITGGIINASGTNTRLGAGDWMVVETDESDGSFLRLPATIGVVTNIDPEHLDHHGTFENLQAAFTTFLNNLPFYGLAVVCADHAVAAGLQTSRRRLTYGFSEAADVRGAKLVMDAEGCHFAVHFKDRTVAGYHLPLHGRHNAQNALAAIAIANDLNIPDALVQKALATFSGVKRRFSHVGTANGVRVIDDYGHHPVEIAAVLQAARGAVGAGRIIAVIQPHRYSRLHNLMAEFAACVFEADHVLVADVYAAGEAPIAGASAAELVARMQQCGHASAAYLPSPEALPAMVQALAKRGDMVVCLGAGSITSWAHALPDALKKLAEAAA